MVALASRKRRRSDAAVCKFAATLRAYRLIMQRSAIDDEGQGVVEPNRAWRRLCRASIIRAAAARMVATVATGGESKTGATGSGSHPSIREMPVHALTSQRLRAIGKRQTWRFRRQKTFSAKRFDQ
jgi:hypothetical protein